MKTHVISRTVAADLIEKLRSDIALGATKKRLESSLRLYGVEPLEPCDGGAHQDLNIDHCLRCAPRWGFVGARVRIR